MFIKRLITTVILVPLVAALILFSSSHVFQFITLLIALYCAWEWSMLAGIKDVYKRTVYCVFMLATLSVVQFIPYREILWVGTLWWFFAIYLLWRYTTQAAQYSKPILMLVGFFAIVPFWVALNALRASPNHGSVWVLVFLILLWSTDIGAYLVGMRWGRRKLAPKLSPGKSIEGAMGGIGLALILALVSSIFLGLSIKQVLLYLLITLVMAIFSIVGDLFESMLKRLHGVKDSGSILPGHGGMLDRLDSTLAAVPIFTLLALLGGLL